LGGGEGLGGGGDGDGGRGGGGHWYAAANEIGALSSPTPPMLMAQ
jgi:hypothetical protein